MSHTKGTLGRSRTKRETMSENLMENMSPDIHLHMNNLRLLNNTITIDKLHTYGLDPSENHQPIFIQYNKENELKIKENNLQKLKINKQISLHSPLFEKTQWKSQYNLDNNPDMKSFIEKTLKTYSEQLDKYHYNSNGFRIRKIIEAYEISDNEIKTQLKYFEEGVKQKTNIPELKHMKLKEISDKIDQNKNDSYTPSFADKFNKIGVCPIDYYYGPSDVKPSLSKTNEIEEPDKYLLDSMIEYFQYPDDDDYKWFHLRQYVLGTLNYTRLYERYNKYFKFEPDIAIEPKHSIVGWNMTKNDIFIKCMFEFMFNKKTPTLFPVRLVIDRNYIDVDRELETQEPKLSQEDIVEIKKSNRYSHVTQDDVKDMTYQGCMMIPVHEYKIKLHDFEFEHKCPNENCYFKTMKTKQIEKYIDIELNLSYKQYIDPISGKHYTLYGLIQKELKNGKKYSIDFEYYLNEMNKTYDYITGNGDADGKYTLYGTCNEPIRFDKKYIIHYVMPYIFFVMSRDNKPKLINFRSNYISIGDLLERFKFIHVEVNQLYHIIHEMTGREPILQRYIPDADEKLNSKYVFFLSPYDNSNDMKLGTLKEKIDDVRKTIGENTYYNGNITQETFNEFISKIKPYKLKLQPNSHIFELIPVQYGGKKSSMYNKGNMSKKNTSISNKISKTASHTKRTISLSPGFYGESYIVKLMDMKDVEYKWNVKKSKKEEIFHNYPVEKVMNSIQQYNDLLQEIAKQNKVTDTNSPKVLTNLNKLHHGINIYSQLGSMFATEYVDTDKIITKGFPESYVKDKYDVSRHNSILYHKLIYHYISILHFYINNHYNLLPYRFNSSFKILNISHHLGYAESCIYKYIKTTKKELLSDMIHSKLLIYPFNNLRKNSINSMRYIYKYTNFNYVEQIWSPLELENIIENSEKFNLAFVDVHAYYNSNYKLLRINQNHMLMLAGLIISLKTLKNDGALNLELANSTSKFSQDLIFIVTQHFKKVEIFKAMLSVPSYSGTQIICTGFKPSKKFDDDIKEMIKIYKDMYKIDTTGGLLYTPNQPNIEKILGIKHITPKPNQKYFNSLVDAESLIYSQIESHHTLRTDIYAEYIDKMQFYFEHILPNKSKHNRILLFNTYRSIQMANLLDIKVNSYLNIKQLKSDIEANVYRNMYGLDSTIYYKFRLYPEKLKIMDNAKLQGSNQYLLEQILRMENATKVFDTRKIENYDKLKKKLRYYEKTLNNLIKEDFNAGIPIKNGKYLTHPSRAWIKMYEIAEVTKLIPKKANNYKALCFCEAPGNFVLAINHFIKTKTEIKKFDWIAQSYNPDANRDTRDFHVIGDDYDLMRKYPDRWDFGPKNTGDVTDPDNIRYYGAVYNDVDLLTSDCGTDWGGDDLISSKLMFGQLMFVLNNLPEGKNFVIKYYIPFIHYPAQLALFYVIYQSFKEISFYKPLQNAWSHEFYLVGKKYKKLDYDQLKPFFDIMENYNPYMSPINLNKIPDEFMKQIEKATKDVVDRFVFYIERYIYYLDLMEDGKKPDFDVIQNHIDIRNKEWVKAFKIQKINDDDKI